MLSDNTVFSRTEYRITANVHSILGIKIQSSQLKSQSAVYTHFREAYGINLAGITQSRTTV